MSQSPTTAITKLENLPNIHIYPNPAQQQITIEIAASDIPIGGYNLWMVDVLGRMVLSENTIKNDLYPVNIANIPNGQYVIVLRDKFGAILKREIIEIWR